MTTCIGVIDSLHLFNDPLEAYILFNSGVTMCMYNVRMGQHLFSVFIQTSAGCWGVAMWILKSFTLDQSNCDLVPGINHI